MPHQQSSYKPMIAIAVVDIDSLNVWDSCNAYLAFVSILKHHHSDVTD